MKERILGIDTGTNSLGWAIVDYDSEATEDKYTLIDKGVNIFQEGVKIEKGNESSRAAERTGHRRLRIGYWRRKVRKINLLRILIENKLCPPISPEELKTWRIKKIYPKTEAFMQWQRTDEETDKNPYYCRNLCLTKKLDLGDKNGVLSVDQRNNRYMLGRAFYHINQRRGFLSNRKESTKESEGAVKENIDNLTQAMQECGMEYLGQYFYMLYHKGEKIRKNYTSRISHFEKELLRICEVQGLDETFTKKLHHTIISQRPLKSQKHTVGRCVFEKSKSRCPVSHPLFEQYRMYAFINNIKIQSPKDNDLRPLNDDEKALIIPLFLRKSKKDFNFEDIAKKLSVGKKTYCYYKDKEQLPYRFNFYMDTSVSSCPVIAQLSEVYGLKDNVDEWLERACETYTKADGKSRFEILNDIWHALFFFGDEDKLKEWAKVNLQLEDEQAELFSKIRIPSDYASLSLNAIRKILPYMKYYGMIYSHAVFMANLSSIVPCDVDKDVLLPKLPMEDARHLVEAIEKFEKGKRENATEIKTKEEYVKLYVMSQYHLGEQIAKKLNKLYHPSMIETFPKVRTKSGDTPQLGSPRTNSMRNPMAMHSLFRLRHVVNELLREGKINQDTIIHIEFARELNDANKRVAIQRWQREREKKNAEYSEEIRKYFGGDYNPSNEEILKYRLWEEQNHLCLYTEKKIGFTELFDSNKYDIEHTIPRSVGGDTTAENLTICDCEYNRKTKRTKLPSELDIHEEILERISGWKEKYEALDKQIRKINTRGVSDKAMKDRLIQKRHLLTLDRDYWKGKYNRFTMTEVPEGFSRRQGVNISVISKYARQYLKSLFRDTSGRHNDHIQVVKGIATSDFRKIWGIQEEYSKKERVNHCHHAIDAIVVACIGEAEYDKLAQYYNDSERRKWGLDSRRATFPKPWKTFTEDIKQIEESLLVSHYTRDNMAKRTRKKLRKNGKFVNQYMQGDTARKSLHQDTYYGAIKRDEEIRYVVRKPIDTLEDKDVEKIVDDVVRQKVLEAKEAYGNLKEALKEEGIWMNREKNIPIHKVRVYAHTNEPMKIRKHRDESRKDYKRTFYVVNDDNYVLGIYVGKDGKGKEKRVFQLVTCLDATKHFNGKGSSELLLTEKDGCPLKWKLKVGTMVLLYENTPEEIYNADRSELSKRLYKVYGMDKNGIIKLSHQQEARSAKDVIIKHGQYTQGNEIYPRRWIRSSHFNALVEGQDFIMNDIGEITFLNK